MNIIHNRAVEQINIITHSGRKRVGLYGFLRAPRATISPGTNFITEEKYLVSGDVTPQTSKLLALQGVGRVKIVAK